MLIKDNIYSIILHTHTHKWFFPGLTQREVRYMLIKDNINFIIILHTHTCFFPGLTQREVRYLLIKVQEWDVTGAGKATLDDIYQVW